MPKTKISEFSATPANNTDIDSINIAEGCAPSGINDAIRELMAQLKDFQTGAVGDSFNGPVGTSTAAAGAFTTLSASSTATLSGLTASTALALDASKNVVSVTNTGTGNNVLATSPTLVTPILGTPTSATLTNATGLPIATGVSGLGTGVATFLATPSSANLAAALTDETGSGANVFATSPTLVTPILGTPTSATLTNATGLPLTTGVTGTLPTANGGTNLGGATPFTANGVVYASSSSALATGSALTFDGTTLGVSTSSSVAASFNRQSANGKTLDISLVSQSMGWLGSNGNGDFVISSSSGGIASNQISFATSSGTEALRLTSTSLYTASGINVGIGTSSPSQKLTVNGVVASIGPATALTASSFFIDYNTTANLGRLAAVGNTTGTAAPILFSQYSSNASVARDAMIIDSAGNLGLGVTPSAWSTGKALEVGAVGCGFWTPSAGNIWSTSNAYYDTSLKYAATGYAASAYQQASGVHYWYTAPSGTAGNPISFTQAATLTADGNYVVGDTASSFRIAAVVQGGANRDIFQAAIFGYSNGLTVKWNHSTSTTRVNIQNLPTSATGLASGDLYVLAGALMVA